MSKLLFGSLLLIPSASAVGVPQGQAFELSCETTGRKVQHLSNNGSSLDFVGTIELTEAYLVDPTERSVTLLSRKGVDRPDPAMTGVETREVDIGSQFFQDVRALNAGLVVFCPEDTNGCKTVTTDGGNTTKESQVSLVVINLREGSIAYRTSDIARMKRGSDWLSVETAYTGVCERT